MDDGATIAGELLALDSLTVDVITDNVSDSYVSKTLFAVSEFANVVNAGADVISGETLLAANLGYGLLLRSRVGGVEHVLLFDTGPEGAIFIRNCKNLALDLGQVEEVAISHGHWDHMGALPAALAAILEGRPSVSVHVNPGMFNQRGVLLKSGAVIPVADVPDPGAMEALGARVVNEGEPRLLLDRHFFLSGEIPRVSSFEKGRVDHLCRSRPNEAWRPDPLLMDERMLVAHVRDLGLVVFSACSHAGIVNVCTEVSRLYPGLPIHAVMGGLHLGGVMERLIPQTVEGLEAFDIRNIVTGHCTGWRALHALADAFGDKVSQSAIGTTYTFDPSAPVLGAD
ncbi:MBL fold metallo-hydrolase [Chelatococcus reniformis]|uniref:MBL fold metallo-hydrolase n=1 Tax=Chelatococcus reniformis TaxID=1494448 RepID=A0A916XHR1_9HYPH|nr:MBL fold metallo-hydrolase [Chelatococcus reniformis]GGC71334.1 MBL fold metallo-hydrolase [Chelatococcus reniformis]